MKKTILIVCDDPARRAELAALLNANSYRALSSETGRQASAALTGNLVSLILVDCITASRLPGCGLRASRTMADGFVPRIQQRQGFRTVSGSEALLFSGLGVFEVEHATALAAVEDEAAFHRLSFFAGAYGVSRGVGCIRYTRRAANPAVTSGCRVVPG